MKNAVKYISESCSSLVQIVCVSHSEKEKGKNKHKKEVQFLPGPSLVESLQHNTGLAELIAGDVATACTGC